jgi:hypothetical protein
MKKPSILKVRKILYVIDHGEGWGSGSYIRLGERRYVLTNEHVATIRHQGRRLGHQLLNDEVLNPIVGNHVEFPLPLDLALLPVSEKAWAARPHGSDTIDIDQIALAHDPVPGELLALTGFSGEATQFHFGTLFGQGTCYMAREVVVPEDPRFRPRYHIGLDYRPDLATGDPRTRGLPLPPGLSGSTVWNTQFVAARMAGMDWTPEMARVTGVVWGWHSSAGCLLVTRSEYLRSFLLLLRVDPPSPPPGSTPEPSASSGR